MRRAARTAVAVAALAVVALTSGCGVGPSGVEDGGEAPTGVAAGPTLYFVDADDRLRPDLRDTGRLGTVHGAIQLLIADTEPTGAGLRNEIPPSAARTVVEDGGDRVTIYLPLHDTEISDEGVDQIICTATAVVAASGREVDDVAIEVRPTHGGAVIRPCPVRTAPPPDGSPH